MVNTNVEERKDNNHWKKLSFRIFWKVSKDNSTDYGSNQEKDQATKSTQEDALVYGADEGRDKLR